MAATAETVIPLTHRDNPASLHKLTFIVPFSENSINAAFLQAFGYMADFLHPKNVELLIVETGDKDTEDRSIDINRLDSPRGDQPTYLEL